MAASEPDSADLSTFIHSITIVQMHPILFRLGPTILYSYTAVWGVGISIGLLYGGWLDYNRWRDSRWLGDGIWLLGAGLLGGRLGFLGQNWAYYLAEPQMTWQLGQGGLNYHGVIAGVGVYLWWRRQRLAYSWRWLALLAPWLHVTGWLACYLQGCGCGRPATAALWTAVLPDQFGVLERRYQTQLLGIIFSLLVLLLVAVGQRRRQDPRRWFWRSWLLLGLADAGITLLRIDTALLLGGWRSDTILNLVVIAGSLVMLWAGRARKLAQPGLYQSR